MGKRVWTREELGELATEAVEKLLNDREKLFVHEYLLDLNATAAAIRAGYAEKSASSQGCKLLRRPEVAEYRDRKVKEKFEALGITREFVKLECFEVLKRCMDKEPVLEWNSQLKEWAPSGTWQFDAKGALKALDQMAGLLDMKRPEGINPGKTVEGYLARMGENRREF